MLSEAQTLSVKGTGNKGKFVSQTISVMSKTGLFAAYGFFRSHLVKQQVAIIVYHRVSRVTDYPWSLTPVTPQSFEQEIEYLSRTYRVISLDELCTSLKDLKTLPPKTAVVTFDDGYKDTYLHAYPILKKYSIPATVFLTTGHIGTGNLFWWDKVNYVLWETKRDTIDLGELGVYHLDSAGSRLQLAGETNKKLKNIPDEKRRESIDTLVRLSGVEISPDIGKEHILSWDEIKEMSQNGISFGAHTVSHPILTRLPLEAAKKEIINSKRQIEEQLGQEITTFSYPNGEPGDYNSDIEGFLKSHGFKCALILVPSAFVSPTTQLYRLPRITGVVNFDVFKLLISGLYFDLLTMWGHPSR